MFKRIILFLAKNLLRWAVLFIWDYVDKNDDGKISKKEINLLIEELKQINKKIRR